MKILPEGYKLPYSRVARKDKTKHNVTLCCDSLSNILTECCLQIREWFLLCVAIRAWRLFGNNFMSCLFAL